MSAFASRWVLQWLADEPTRLHRRLDDAALVFLDISGFTAMSEMLASLGRIGSEEVREVVNQTFTTLLDLAYAEGASLLKFGGDALLLLFAGDDANDAAVRSAWAMRNRLHADNPVATAAGSIALDMTVGVHAGPVDLFLVGDGHRELIVAGPAGTSVIETEGAAERGQILLSPTVTLGAGMQAADLPDGRRELVEVAPFEPGRLAIGPAPSLSTDHQVVSAPVAARVAGDHRGEHRNATIAFIHFSGTDRLLADRGPAALADALQELTSIIQTACASTDVCLLSSDIDADGGKFILTAGVPVAADDDDDRMVTACRRIVEAEPTLPVQIGVNRGPVFSGVVGPPYRLTYTVLGDAVNLAARIMSRAGHGEVLAEAELMNSCRTLFDVAVVEPFHVKGKQAPVRAIRVGQEIGVRIRIRTDNTGFVGRETAVAELVDRLDTVIERGHGSAFAITGPAGIGKSRLVDELQERRPAVPFHLVACSRFGAERPYRAAGMLLRLVLTGERHGPPNDVVDAARKLAGHDDLVGPWLPLLADVYDVDVEDTPETRALAPNFRGAQTRRLISLLLASALWGPAVLVIEDIQWLDPESRELLVEQGVHVLQDRPWLIVGTTRDTSTIVDGMHEMALDPLGDDAAKELLLAAVDRGELSIDWIEAVAERAGGNPLFLLELIRTAKGGELPDSLESLFQNRLDSLEPAHRRLLVHAAVLGLEFPPNLLESISDAAGDISLDDLDSLGEFVTRMRSGYWRFTQSLYQEVAYASLPYRQRRRLHAGAARALESVQQAGGIIAIEALSRHHHLAGEYDKSWNSSRQAFAVARGRSAVETAARFARRSLEAGQRIKAPRAAIARVWEGLGEMLELVGAYPDAEAAYRSARKHGDLATEARLCRRVGNIKSQRTQYSQALRWYSKSARAATEQAQDDELAQTKIKRGITLMRQGDRRAAVSMSEDVLANGAEGEVRAQALWLKGWALSEDQSLDAEEILVEAGHLFNELGDLVMESNVVNVLGADAYYRGDWTAAVDYYERARDISDRMGDRSGAAMSAANLGEILADQGHFERARATLRSAYDFGRASRGIYIRVGALVFMARAAVRSGLYDEALSELTEVIDLADEGGVTPLLVDGHLRMAELALFRGDPEGAAASVAMAREAANHHPPPLLETLMLRLEGCIAAEMGQDPEAGLEASRRLAVEHGMGYEEFLAVAALQAHGLRTCEAWLQERSTDLGIVCPPVQLVHGPGALE